MALSRTLLGLALASVVTGTSAAHAADSPISAPASPPAPSSTPPVTVTSPARAVAADIPAPPPTPDESPGTSGYHNGTFYIRSSDDVFRLYIQGRVHADWSDQLSPGSSALPAGSGLNDGFYLRRARLELAGEFYEKWQWMIGAEFSSATSVDNAAATQATPTCSADPTTGVLTCSNKENAVQNPTVKAIPTDVFVNYGPSPWANIQVGQFYLPFTLENRISDNTTPFIERSMAVRNIGAPLQRDIGAMFWGESPDRVVYYAAGIFNGDGPNRPNSDGRYDFAGRAFVRPFMTGTSSAKWAQIGASVHLGSRDPGQVGYDMPSLTTQEGYPFWKPTYKDSLSRTIHVIPSAGQWALAGDIYVPLSDFDFTGEFIYTAIDTREAVDGYQLSPFTERLGTFDSYGWYAQVSYWIFGDHDIIGHPSYGRPIHVDLTKPRSTPHEGLQVLAKVEELHVDYEGSARGGVSDAKTPNGTIEVDDVELGINYWATKHLRVSFNYGFYYFPSSEPLTASETGGPTQTSSQRALAPAQLLPKGVDSIARDSSHTLNELAARVGVQF